MSADDLPRTEARSAQVPPNRRPPTATGTDTPEPPRNPDRSHQGHVHIHVERHVHLLPGVGKFIRHLLSTLDDVAEAIATELRGEEPAAVPPKPQPPAV